MKHRLMKDVRSLLATARLTSLLALLALSLPVTAAIYRTVDAAGNITYTDQPPAGAARDTRTISEQIEVQSPNTFEDSTPPTPYESWNPDASDTEEIAYQSLEITAPPNNEAFRDNAGNVVIRSRLTPVLQAGHALYLEINGTMQTDPADGADVYLTNVSRGTHRIRMVVLDKNGNRKIESKEQTFHLQRPSIQLPPASKKTPPA